MASQTAHNKYKWPTYATEWTPHEKVSGYATAPNHVTFRWIVIRMYFYEKNIIIRKKIISIIHLRVAVKMFYINIYATVKSYWTIWTITNFAVI